MAASGQDNVEEKLKVSWHFIGTKSLMNTKYSGGWNTEHVRNSNDWGLLCFPMVDEMAAILFCFPMVRIIRKQNKIPAILFLDHCKTELQIVRYSNDMNYD